MTAPYPSLKDGIAAALEWWSAAGVDADYCDDPTDWLAQPELAEEQHGPAASHAAPPEPEALEKPAAVDLLGADPPGDLPAFRQFWLTSPKLAQPSSGARIAPRGEDGARLMVIVATPEQGDKDRLLSGPQGRLLEKIMAAMGLHEDEVYLASAVPQALPLADGQELERAGFGRVLAHHISLVQPARVLALGSNILPLLGHSATQEPETIQEFAANSAAIPLLAAEGLEALAGMPRLKARFWRRWIAHIAG